MPADPRIRTLETACLRAWPALREGTVERWTLRFSAGFTRRANSVQPWHPDDADGAAADDDASVSARIARCEAAYAELNLPCVFKLSPLAEPPDLDARLAAAGYRREGETCVQHLPVLQGVAADDTACRVTDPLDDAWQATYLEFDETPERHHSTFRAILAAIDAPNTGALLREGDADVACGRAVLTDGRVGLYDIATHPAHRRRGFAERIVRQLLAWGAGQGAREGYLQAEADNAPARRLYERLGFREVYRYAYRVK